MKTVEAQRIEHGKPVKTTLRFDRLIQVRIVRGVFSVDLELIGRNAVDSLTIPGLPKADAENAKSLIDAQMRSTIRPGVSGRLASWQLDGERSAEELRARIAIVESEFQASRRELLSKVEDLSRDLREFKLLMAATTIYVSAQEHGSGIRGCVDAAQEILEEIQRREIAQREPLSQPPGSF